MWCKRVVTYFHIRSQTSFLDDASNLLQSLSEHTMSSKASVLQAKLLLPLCCLHCLCNGFKPLLNHEWDRKATFIVGAFLQCKSKKHIYCAKNLTFFTPPFNSYTKWEDFKHTMKNLRWLDIRPDFNSKSLVDLVLAGFLKPRFGTLLTEPGKISFF